MPKSDLIRSLNIPLKTLDALQNIPMPENHEHLKELFFAKPDDFRKSVFTDLNGLEILQLYLDWLTDVKSVYDSHRIPDSYFWDSCKDISIWCDDYLVRFGKPGFIEWDWVGKTLRLEVIRIGRLQFEPDVLRKELPLAGQTFPAGTPILHVHIPAGEPLDTKAVLSSLHEAPVFFRKYFHREFILFHCHSWLLSPDLKNLLNEGSRIIQFQNLFQVYATDDDRQAEERVFGFLSDNPADYPENTSLQRTVKEHLLAGSTVHMAAGIKPIE